MKTRRKIGKVFSRVSALLLIMVMMVGILPITEVLAADSITLTRSSSTYKYPSGYGTYYFEIDGRVAYCVHPKIAAPKSGTYSNSKVSEIKNENLLKALYYCHGGDGANEKITINGKSQSVKDYANSAGLTGTNVPYMLAHRVMAYFYGESSWSYSLNATWKSVAENIINGIKNANSVSSFYSGYVLNIGSANQHIVFTKSSGTVKVQKVGKSSDILLSSKYFSLSGAVYTVYSDSKCTDKIGSMTTNAKGAASYGGLSPGTYYIKETTASKGYNLDETVHKVTVTAGKTATITSTEPYQQGKIQIIKKPTDEDSVKGNDNYSLEGAVFGIYDEKDKLVQKVTTDKQGKATSDYLPVGLYKVKELVAPTGYMINETEFSVVVQKNKVTNLNVAEDSQKGYLLVRKHSANEDMTDNNAMYELAGAEFEVYNSSNELVDTIYINSNGLAVCWDLPLDTYTVKETGAPMGYAIDAVASEGININLNGGSRTANVYEPALNDPVDILLSKYDSDLNEPTGRLAGAIFAVEYYDGFYDEDDIANMDATRTWYVQTNEKGYARLRDSSLVTGNSKYVSDEFYYALSGSDHDSGNPVLPLGTVVIYEVNAPKGYVKNENIYLQWIENDDAGLSTVVSYNAPEIPNTPIHGGVYIEKWDYELDENTPQGDLDFTGTTIEIINNNSYDVVVEGERYASGEVVYTLVTNAEGHTTTNSDTLPYGDYMAREVISPSGYQLLGQTETEFSIAEEGVLVPLATSDSAIKDIPIKTSVVLNKEDSTLKVSGATQGDATLAGAEFEVYNRSTNTIVYNSQKIEVGGLVATLTTGDDGYIDVDSLLLPAGTYEVIETKAPDGYLLPVNNNRFNFSINKSGSVDGETTIYDDIITGGFKLQKRDAETGLAEPQGSATFEGMEVQLTNMSKEAVIVDGVPYKSGEVINTFTTDASGYLEMSGLPYGTYKVQETAAPDGYLLKGVTEITFSIRTNGEMVDLTQQGSCIEDYIKRGDFKGVKITEGQERLAYVPWQITSKTTGESHVIVGDVNGEFNTSSAWSPHSRYTNRGETEEDGIWFGDINALDDSLGALPYDTYIVEELECQSNIGYELTSFEIVIYKDSETIDVGTVTNYAETPPTLGTKAHDSKTGKNDTYVSEKTTIVDIVSYDNLKVGREYTIDGYLMLKETNEPLLINGERVTASVTFTAEGESGTAELTYTFDSSVLAGQTVVVFEDLYYKGVLLATHSDINDPDQSIEFKDPEVGTSASDVETGTNQAHINEITKLEDIVSYKNLVVGFEYKVQGILMDAETGEPILVNGDTVTAEAKFTPESTDGTVSVIFEFESLSLEGKKVVVFEELYYKDRLLAVHADINDEHQTVEFVDPEIGTTAQDAETEAHEAFVSETTTIIDYVSYKNLVVGQEYTVTGYAVDKETEEYIMVDGEKLTSSATFIPTESTGIAEVEFTFDTRALAGTSIVFYEYLYYNNREIAVHADIDDEGQTITFKDPKIGTSAKDKDSGTNTAKPNETTTIIDTVNYTGLIVGKEYTVKGVLMDKETNEPLLVNGKEIRSELIFTAETTDGSVDLPFTFDSSSLKGQQIVVFEYLYYKDRVITTHTDIEDKDQTITFEEPQPEPEEPQPTPEPDDIDSTNNPDTIDSSGGGDAVTTGDKSFYFLLVTIIVMLVSAFGIFILARKPLNNKNK